MKGSGGVTWSCKHRRAQSADLRIVDSDDARGAAGSPAVLRRLNNLSDAAVVPASTSKPRKHGKEWSLSFEGEATFVHGEDLRHKEEDLA